MGGDRAQLSRQKEEMGIGSKGSVPDQRSLSLCLRSAFPRHVSHARSPDGNQSSLPLPPAAFPFCLPG